jgi:hypothetical protein
MCVIFREIKELPILNIYNLCEIIRKNFHSKEIQRLRVKIG